MRFTTRTTRSPARGVILLSLAALALPGAMASSAPKVHVLVQGTSSAAASAAVVRTGNTVTTELSVIDGVVADVRADDVAQLRRQPGVLGVSTDSRGELESVLPGTTYDTETESGSMWATAQNTGITTFWNQGFTGSGVGVAVIDSGVQPSAFFGTRLVAGADFSGAGNALADGFGHGTHLAGIIAGQSGPIGAPGSFTGMAPNAKIISVRVADNLGISSLTKIVQGLDWVYKNRTAQGIKVANLSMGVPAYDDYTTDPLAAAVERLWSGGVTVVASAGNIGAGRNLTSPAYDPTIIAVGALDTKGTVDPSDDAPAAFSASAADWLHRRPDVLAPGRSILSIKATNSVLAGFAPPSSKIGTSFLKGSGTSQAAAVVSGELATLMSAKALTPDEAKWNLMNMTQWVAADQLVAGNGRVNVPWFATRLNLAKLVGLQWNLPAVVSPTAVSETSDSTTRKASWQGATWQGQTWQGSTWSGSTWRGSTWSGAMWLSLPI